ncbi:MAG: zinc-dependent metalloprotease, partial [Actinomycetota bacterium]
MSDHFGQDPDFLGKIPLFAELQRLMSWDGGPINWDLAEQVAAAAASQHEGAGANAVPREEIDQAFDLAGRLIADATSLEVAEAQPETLGAVSWSRTARTRLGPLMEPVAARSAGTDLTEAFPVPEGMPIEELSKALQAAGPMLFAFQAGSAVGAASGLVTGWSDLGIIPEVPSVELLPASLGRHIREASIDERAGLQAAALQSLAARTVAHMATTLRTRWLAAFLETVAALEIDLAGMGDRLPDLSDPEAMMNMLQGGFEFEPGPAAQTARERVEAIGGLFLAATDLVARAGGARAGIPGEVFDAVTVARRSPEVTALRSVMALPPLETTPATGFVQAVVAEGGYELLQVALDDPLRGPEV